MNTAEGPLEVETNLPSNLLAQTSLSTTSSNSGESPIRSSIMLKSQKSLVDTKNANLDSMNIDFLYHLGLTKEDAASFSGIKYVCIGGTNDRMTHFANSCGKKFGE
jgi:hypothetical protein